MYCRKCGTEISDDSIFCYKCGEKHIISATTNPQNKTIPFNNEESKKTTC